MLLVFAILLESLVTDLLDPERQKENVILTFYLLVLTIILILKYF